jgi:hypothetical protein
VEEKGRALVQFSFEKRPVNVRNVAPGSSVMLHHHILIVNLQSQRIEGKTSFHMDNIDDAKRIMCNTNQESILVWHKKHLLGTKEEHKAFIVKKVVDYERFMREI